MSAPQRERVDQIDYYIAHCDRAGCEQVDLGIDQHPSDAWNAYIAHCRDLHGNLVVKKPMIRTTTWSDAPEGAAAQEEVKR